MNYVPPKHHDQVQNQLAQIYVEQQDTYDHAFTLLSQTELPGELEMEALARLMDRSSTLQSRLPELLTTWESQGRPTSHVLRDAVDGVRRSIQRLLSQIEKIESRASETRSRVLPELKHVHHVRRVLAAYGSSL